MTGALALGYHEISAVRRTVGAFPVELLPGAAYAAHDASDLATLGIALERQRGVHAIASDRRTDFDAWAGTASFTPPGVDVYSESDAGGEYLVVRWRPAAGDRPLPSLRSQHIGQSALLERAFRMRAALLAADAGGDDATLDGHLQELLSHSGHLCAPPGEQGQLQRKRLHARYAEVLQCIEDGLPTGGQALSLAALASRADETPLRFLRGFHQATGMTPHAYIIERRLQFARRLMRDPRCTLAAVAADAGYASQSHMGRHFSERLGMSPGRYRAGMKSDCCPAAHPRQP